MAIGALNAYVIVETVAGAIIVIDLQHLEKDDVARPPVKAYRVTRGEPWFLSRDFCEGTGGLARSVAKSRS